MRELPTGTVTLLFTDIEGSTRLLEEHGERYADLLAEHRRVLREAFAAHRGIEVDTQGDSFFVAFSRASDALAAVEEAHATLALPIRMGIHTGEPQLTPQGYVGMDVHRAARICAAGHGGQVLLSQATRDLIEGDVQELGVHRLKDVGELRLYQLGERRFPPIRSLNQTNLPLRDEPLVGRKKELADVLRLIRVDGARLVTLTGPGGIGKTSFAVELAAELVEDFADGVWFVDLSALRDPELVGPTISSTLGAKRELAAHVSVKELLLVLDNFEQVVEGAPQLSVLLDRCPNLSGLVTSREPLRLGRERTYPLRPLAESPAVELFRRRATALDPDFEATYEQLVELCARLDNLPLALELAAARTQALSVPQLLERLEERLPLLSARRRDVPERQRTLRATIEWSYELLDPHEQQLFRALSVFAGGFTLDAAEKVCDAHLDTLESLVAKSLIRRDANRFRMLETVREFALECLEAAGDADYVRRRQAEQLLELGEAGANARGEEREAWVVSLPAELANLREAFPWSVEADPELALRLCWVLSVFQAPAREQRRWIDDALERRDDVDIEPLVRARALHAAAYAASLLGDHDRAEPLYQESLQLYRELGDDRGIARMLAGLAFMAAQEEPERARALFAQSLALYRALRDLDGEWIVLNNLGEVEREACEYERATDLLERAVVVARRNGDAESIGMSLHGLGDVALEVGDIEDAFQRYRESLAIARRLKAGRNTCFCLGGLASAAAGRQDALRAGVFWGALEALEDDLEMRLPAGTRSRYERWLTGLDESAFAIGLDEGRKLTLDAALERASAD